MILALLASAPTIPVFTAKFVPADLGGTRPVILDSTRDLNAVGFGVTYMIDIDPKNPFCVFRGRAVSVPQKSWPMSISADGSCACYRGEASPDDLEFDPNPHFFLGRVVGSTLRMTNRSRPVQTRFSRGFQAFGNINKWNPAWWPSAISPENRNVDGDSVQAQYVGFRTYRVVNLTFYPITPGYDNCMHDAERSVPLLEVQDVTKKLEDCTLGLRGIDLQKVLWVAPEGWMIAQGEKHHQGGLVWLYPTTIAKRP